MRAVNLIPIEERRGQSAALRSGPIAYIVLGALVAALAGVTALVLSGNEVSDRKAEVVELHRELGATEARAQRLAAYTEFKLAHDQRVETVRSLADSRFDWERVMRELSLLLPSDVWLTGLTATASPEVQIEGGSSGSSGTLRSDVAGPALEMSGCATGQEAVASFVTVLKNVDGVTRVGVQESALGEEGAGGSSEDAGSETDCRTRRFIAQFQIIVAFDAAPVAPVAGGEAPPVEEPAEGESAEGEESSESTPTSGEG